MAETPKPIPDSAVQDKALAEEMAYAEKPYRELQSHAKELGVDNAANQMDIHATEAAKAIVEGRNLTNEEITTEEPTANPEKTYTPESISTLLDDTYFVASVYSPKAEHPGQKRLKQPGVGNKDLQHAADGDSSASAKSHSGDVIYALNNFPGQKLWEKLYKNKQFKEIDFDKQFSEAGIPEVVTLFKLPAALQPAEFGRTFRWPFHKFGDVVPGSPKGDEPVYSLAYSTIRGGDSEGKSSGFRYPYPDSHGRAGNSAHVRVLLPESEAQDLSAAMQKNPQLAREMLKAAVQMEMGGGEPLWGDVRPPYERWKEIDGVSRMAFRTSLDQLPEQSKTVEF